MNRLRWFGIAALVAGVGMARLASQSPPAANEVHLHHVHLNVTDPQRTADFYQQVFGARAMKYDGRTDALQFGRAFLLMNKVSTPASSDWNTGLWHLGLSVTDVPAEFVYLRSKGVQFQTPAFFRAPLFPDGTNLIMFALGPDQEMWEIKAGPQRYRFDHMHLVARDPLATVRWYTEMLGVPARQLPPPAAAVEPPPPNVAGAVAPVRPTGPRVAGLLVDDVGVGIYTQGTDDVPKNVYGKVIKIARSSKGTVLDHWAFSYRDIQPVFDRLQKAGVTVVEPIAMRPDFGFRSFFVEGPDNVLVEIVEANALP